MQWLVNVSVSIFDIRLSPKLLSPLVWIKNVKYELLRLETENIEWLAIMKRIWICRESDHLKRNEMVILLHVYHCPMRNLRYKIVTKIWSVCAIIHQKRPRVFDLLRYYCKLICTSANAIMFGCNSKHLRPKHIATAKTAAWQLI